MEYRLTAGLAPPAGAAPLDELQQLGAAALLAEWLERVATIEGPDGVEITPYDHEVDMEPTRAVVRLLVEAPALAFAESGAEALLQEILERTEHLGDWAVGKCEVTVTDAELARAVSSEEGERGLPPSFRVPEEVRTEQRRRLRRFGPHLRAFDATAFGAGRPEVPAEGPMLAAGALLHCAAVLTEEIFADIRVLEEDTAGVEITADDYEAMFVLHDLPPRYRSHYDASFAKRFQLAAASVFSRLTSPEWSPPRCTAEALALRLLLRHMEDLLTEQAGLPEKAVAAMLAEFHPWVFEGFDHEWWYRQEPDSAEAPETEAAATVAAWFRSHTGSAAGIHPYLLAGD